MSNSLDNLLADAVALQLAGQTLTGDLLERLGQMWSTGSRQRRAWLARVLAAGRPEAALPWLVLLLADPDAGVASEAIGSIRELIPWSTVRPYADGIGYSAALGRAIATALPKITEEGRRLCLTRLVELHGATHEISISLGQISPVLSETYKRLVQQVAAHHYPPQITVAITYRCNADCPYCYASVERDGHKATITLDHFAEIVQHAARMGFKRVGFTGGEPTLHPHFVEFIRLVGEQGMTVFFASNGMFQPKLVDSLRPDVVSAVTAHIWFAPNFGGKRERVFVGNLRQMHTRGLKIMLRYNLRFNIPVPLSDLERIYWESRASQINLAITVPNVARQNQHVARQAIITESARLLEAARAMRKIGLRPAFAKPLPPCVATKADWRWLGSIPHSTGTCAIWQVGGTHNVLINPDGSVWPCIVLNRLVCQFEQLKSHQQLADLCATYLRNIPKAIDERCHECLYWKSRRCQGSCLAYGCDPKRRSGTEYFF